VPQSGALSTLSEPCSSMARSRMPSRPQWPAIVPHRQAQSPRGVAKPDPHRARVRVLHRVGEGLLQDPRNRRLNRSGHRIGRARHLQLEPELAAAERLLGRLAERVGESAPGHQWGSKIPHRLAGLVQGSLRQRDHVPQRGRGSGVGRTVGHRGELQSHAGEALEQGVVDFPGQPRPLLERGGEARRQDALSGPAGQPLRASGGGHVHDGADELHPAGVPRRAGHNVHVLHPPVGHQQAVVEVPVLLVVGDPVDRLAHCIEVIGVSPPDHVLDRRHLALGIVLEDAEGLFRPAQLGAGEVPAEAPGPAQPLRLREEGLAFPQRGLGTLEIVDIGAAAVPLNDSAALIAERDRPAQHRAIGAVGLTEPDVELIGPARRDGRAPGGLDQGRFVGMEGLEPPTVGRMLRRKPGEIPPRPVDEVDGAVGIGAPHDRGNGVDGEAQLVAGRPGLQQRAPEPRLAHGAKHHDLDEGGADEVEPQVDAERAHQQQARSAQQHWSGRSSQAKASSGHHQGPRVGGGLPSHAYRPRHSRAMSCAESARAIPRMGRRTPDLAAPRSGRKKSPCGGDTSSVQLTPTLRREQCPGVSTTLCGR
jgi:hypothetical protein